MSTYDDSSLFIYPSGYKASVLFAQKPMDANGQLAFTRSNDTATRVDENGLIEKVRTNLILQSNTFSSASWTNNTLVTANNQISPDGTLDASTFTSDGTNHGVLQSLTITSVPHTFSIYAKAGNHSIFRIVNVSSSTNVAWFNLSTGVTSGAIGGTSKIEAVGNGWFRCSYSTNSPNTSTTNQGFVLSDAMGSTGGVASGSTMYFWKSQIERGDIATDPILTTTTAVSVGPLANIPRIDYLGGGCGKLLLEPQRTNLVTFSEQFDNAAWTKFNSSVSANQVISPDGYLNADKLIPNTVAASHQINVSVTGAAHTLSIFAKAGEYSTLALFYTVHDGRAVFNLSNGTITETTGTVTSRIEDYGNGWYRCILSTTLTTHNAIRIYAINGTTWADVSTAGNGTSGIFIYGAQLEAGSYATSYVNTLAASVTRGADACSKTGISSLIGQTEGTLFVDLNYETVSGLSMFLSIRPNSTNKIEVYRDGQTIYGDILGNSVSVLLSKSANPASRYKIALAYKSGQTSLYINGTSVGTSATAFSFATSMADLFINLRSGPTFVEQAFYNQALLFTTRLPNSELASLTAL